MAPSRDRNWQNVQSLEDCMAVLAQVRDRCQVARRHAWRQGSWKQVFAEMTAAVTELDELGAMMSACWEKLFERAKGEKE